jgi:hypothetical protein
MNKFYFFLLISVILLIIIFPVKAKNQKIKLNDEITVAAYYFPNYHTGDPRNDKNMGEGWSEWELVKTAQPRFPNHQQPKVPEWGYLDEKDPEVMAKKIEAAVEHGIDCFIFDWYMYEDGPFLNRCIDEGFLKAKNTETIKFAIDVGQPRLGEYSSVHPRSRTKTALSRKSFS